MVPKNFAHLFELTAGDFWRKVIHERGRVELVHAKLLYVHQDEVKAVKFEAVVLHDLKDCEGHAQQDSHTLQKEQVPNHQDRLEWYLIDEHLDEPREGQQISVEIDVVKVLSQLWVPALHEGVKAFLVDEHAIKACKVVKWVVDLNNLTQSPEGFFFVEAK